MGELVPITMFIMIAVIFCAFFYFRHRTRLEVQSTVRTALEHGQQLTPEVLEGLSDALNSRNGDLRKGLVSIAMGIAVCVFALMIDEPDATAPLMGLSSFPFLIGIAYLVLWRLNPRRAP
ncbi:MAG: DUF6249 domain-containing protein [Pseudomonadales bacterium]